MAKNAKTSKKEPEGTQKARDALPEACKFDKQIAYMRHYIGGPDKSKGSA